MCGGESRGLARRYATSQQGHVSCDGWPRPGGPTAATPERGRVSMSYKDELLAGEAIAYSTTFGTVKKPPAFLSVGSM